MSAHDNTTTTSGAYEPRRSTRVQEISTKADGDTWQEKLVVCEAANGKMVIRSFYRNARTKERVWDEPPSGATAIDHASAKERAEKEEELANFQVAVDITNNNHNEAKDKKKGKGFFSAFRKKPHGKGLFGKKKDKKAQKVTFGGEEDMDGDEDMQRAISLSMGLEPPRPKKPSASPKKKTAKIISQDEQEQLDIAKAISLSQFAETGGGGSAPAPVRPQQPSEEEMLQRVIEASRFETSGAPTPVPAVASMPPPAPDFLGLSEDFSEPLTPQACFDSHASDSSFWNKKMPAQPSPFDTTIPTNNTAMATPYMAAAAANREPPAMATPYTATANNLKPAPSLKPPPAASYNNNSAAATVGAPPTTVASYMAAVNTSNLKSAPAASYNNNSAAANVGAPPAAAAPYMTAANTSNLKPAPSFKPPPPASYNNNSVAANAGAPPTTVASYMAAANTSNLKPAPATSYSTNTAAATLKAPPVASSSLKPPPAASSFDPYAPSPAAAAAAAYPASTQYNNVDSPDSSLRKMEEDDSQQHRKGLVGRRLYNKKNVQVQAGVV